MAIAKSITIPVSIPISVGCRAILAFAVDLLVKLGILEVGLLATWFPIRCLGEQPEMSSCKVHLILRWAASI